MVVNLTTGHVLLIRFFLFRLSTKFDSASFDVKNLKIAWVILPRQPFFQNAYKTLKRSFIKTNLEHIKLNKIVLFYLFAAHCVSKFRILRYFPWVLLKKFQYQENFFKNVFLRTLHWKIAEIIKNNSVINFFLNQLISNVLDCNCKVSWKLFRYIKRYRMK